MEKKVCAPVFILTTWREIGGINWKSVIFLTDLLEEIFSLNMQISIYLPLVHWYQQYITVHHVPKCMSCQKAIVVISRRAHCFHDCI